MKRFTLLRSYLKKYDMDYTDLQRILHKSATYISLRMTGKMPWTQEDQYILMDELDIPYEDMHLAFPKNGISVDLKRKITIDPEDLVKTFVTELTRAVG